jgi:membrane-associated protein
MRIIAGPLAGVLRMPWKRFIVFNFVGAAVWVGAISSVGYFFGRHWARLESSMKRLDMTVAILLVLLAVFLWWRRRRHGSSGGEFGG